MTTRKVKNETGESAVSSYEQAFERLKEIVDLLESGDLDLELSLKTYEEGVKLAKHCQSLLENAELRVRELSKSALSPLMQTGRAEDQPD